jgi:hypothetical protein
VIGQFENARHESRFAKEQSKWKYHRIQRRRNCGLKDAKRLYPMVPLSEYSPEQGPPNEKSTLPPNCRNDFIYFRLMAPDEVVPALYLSPEEILILT